LDILCLAACPPPSNRVQSFYYPQMSNHHFKDI
jgi:hypothetical protein